MILEYSSLIAEHATLVLLQKPHLQLLLAHLLPGRLYLLEHHAQLLDGQLPAV